MNFSAMDQFKTLWEEGRKGGLPIIFNVFDNFYGMGGQTMGETMAYNMPARLGAGITPSQMHAERVDGWNPLAVIDAYKRKMELIKNNEGPVLLDLPPAGPLHLRPERLPYQGRDRRLAQP